MLLFLPFVFRGDLGQQELPAEFAPEAKLSAIHPAWLPGLVLPADLGHRRGQGQRPAAITHAVRLEFQVSGAWFSDEFFVVPDLPCAVRLAGPTIRKWGIGYDAVRGVAWVNLARTGWRLGGPRAC